MTSGNANFMCRGPHYWDLYNKLKLLTGLEEEFTLHTRYPLH